MFVSAHLNKSVPILVKLNKYNYYCPEEQVFIFSNKNVPHGSINNSGRKITTFVSAGLNRTIPKLVRLVYK